MNAADELRINQIRTKPWRELSLCGVSITERKRPGLKKGTTVTYLDTKLAWVERGTVCDEYDEELDPRASVEDLRDYLREIAAFSRGSIPVAWGAQSRALLLELIRSNSGALAGVDTSLCFLLRERSRWLDPSIWCRVRTGKLHPMDTIMTSVGSVKSHSPAVDVVALAYALPTRPGFPVKPEWTASETADWQELQEAF